MSTAVAILVTVLYLTFTTSWILFVMRRLRPWIRHKVEDAMGVSIRETVSRTVEWEIIQPHSWWQGCLLQILNIGVDCGCLVLPLFVVLGVMTVLTLRLFG